MIMESCQRKILPRSTLFWITAFLCTSVTSAASIRAASGQGVTPALATNEQEQRQLQFGGDSFFPSLPPIEGGGDGFMEDADGNGIPDWIDTSMPDWGNMDWGNFSIGDMDWNGIDWNAGAWWEFLQALWGGQNTASGTGSPLDFCPILQSAIGMGQSFGIAGNCTCDGNLGNGLMIDCDFQQCMAGVSTACSTIGLNFTFDDSTGIVNTSVCMDAPEGMFEEFCFSYKLDMPEAGSTTTDVEQSCVASYAGKPCGCTIEGLCVALDCSSYLPGAKMDTCQYLSFVDAGDATTLIPNFPIFNETFNGSFSFGSVNWTNLDWDNVDWNNFGFDRINWTDVNGTWGSIFNAGMDQSDICTILTGRVLSMDANMVNQDCTCTGDLASGFSIKCSFEEECVPTTPTDGTSVSQVEKAATQESTICGDVDLDFAFTNLGSINGSICVDFSDDVHPTTCINYLIPLPNQESQPQCEATYGDKPCKCSIDESLCAKVDCSAYEASAVMDTCQVLSVEQQGDVQALIPRFGLASQTVEEATTAPPEGTTMTQRPSGSVVSEANELNANSSASTSRIISLALAAASILSVVTL